MHAEALHAALETVAPLTAALEPLTAALAPHLAPLAAAARSQAEPFLAPALDAFSAASTALGGPARQLRGDLADEFAFALIDEAVDQQANLAQHIGANLGHHLRAHSNEYDLCFW